MKAYELRRFQTSQALAEAAADAWLEMVVQANRENRSQSVALSGGRIARPFLQAVTERALARNVLFSHVHVFWADERCVPPTDAESNYGLAENLLLKPLSLPPQHVHRLRGEWSPPLAAAAAEEELRRHVPANDQGWPVLDLVFLGMGEDGHVASLFPDGRFIEAKPSAVYWVIEASKPPPLRMTLSYKMLEMAREAWVLVAGSGKAPAVTASLATAPKTPLGRVIQARDWTCLWVEDQAVAEG